MKPWRIASRTVLIVSPVRRPSFSRAEDSSSEGGGNGDGFEEDGDALHGFVAHGALGWCGTVGTRRIFCRKKSRALRASEFGLLLVSLSAFVVLPWDFRGFSWRLLDVSRVLDQYTGMKNLTIFGMSHLR